MPTLDPRTQALVDAVRASWATDEPLESGARDAAARALAGVLKKRHGGRTIEVRVPPLLAVQLAGATPGPKHSRGTPPNVAEMDVDTFLALALGTLTWREARATFAVQASGSHVDDLATMLPVDQSRGSDFDNS